jgi:hypothetical protein
MKEYGGPALDKLQRYTTAALNRMLRCRRELERIRRDEPGPGVADTDIANADMSLSSSAVQPSPSSTRTSDNASVSEMLCRILQAHM